MKKILAFLFLLFLTLGFVQGVHMAHADPYAPVYVTSVRTTAVIGITTPVQLIASLSGKCDQIDVYNSTGQPLELMTGASGSETRIRILSPQAVDLLAGQRILPGLRLSVRSLGSATSSGELDLTCLQF